MDPTPKKGHGSFQKTHSVDTGNCIDFRKTRLWTQEKIYPMEWTSKSKETSFVDTVKVYFSKGIQPSKITPYLVLVASKL